MKNTILIIFCLTILMPTAYAELTQSDLDKIRLIVKEEIDTAIYASEKRMKEYVDLKVETVNTQIQSLDSSLNKRIDDTRNIIYALIALIIFAVSIPAWRNEKEKREIHKKIDKLAKQIEIITDTNGF